MSLLDDVRQAIGEVLGDPEIGRPWTIRRITTTSGGPSGSPSSSIELLEADGYLDAINERNSPAGSTIEIGDELAILTLRKPTDEIRKGDELLRGGQVYRIVNLRPIELGAGVVSYECQVRS
jgi:hypothetical protein